MPNNENESTDAALSNTRRELLKEKQTYEYYYHCTINTLDVLRAGELKAKTTTIGKGSGTKKLQAPFVSLFLTKSKNLSLTQKNQRYYTAPDDRNPDRLGNFCKISCAFVFKEDLKPKENEREENPRCWQEKGVSEHLHGGALKLSSPHFEGIYVPVEITPKRPSPAQSYCRLLAALYLLELKDVKVSLGSRGFSLARFQWEIIQSRLASKSIEPAKKYFNKKQGKVRATDLATIIDRKRGIFGRIKKRKKGNPPIEEAEKLISKIGSELNG